jgi:Na+-transporting NADH:ubiquinone oxidoreductase subunit A
MEAIRIRGGHRFRIKHGPSKEKASLDAPETVGFAPRGFSGLKPKLAVKEGETVKRGQILFHDKKRPDVKFTAPAGGKISELRFGRRRVLQAIAIELDESSEEAEDFGTTDRGELAGLGSEKVVEKLVASGLWTRLVSFPDWGIAPIPGEKLPEPEHHDEHVAEPKSIKAVYVSALATEPHLPDPAVSLDGNEELFAAGLEAIKQIAPATWLFMAKGSKLPSGAISVTGVQHRVVEDKYPAENVGLQAFYTEGLSKDEVAVGVGLEDIIDIGHLFLNGSLRTTRTYAVGGKAAKDRKHFVGRVGLKVADLCGVAELKEDEDLRLIAGGLFSGSKVKPDDYLAPSERSVQVMKEDRERVLFNFLPWRLGLNRLTLSRVYGGGFLKDQDFEATTSNNGEERACVQCGLCIDVCPVELMPNLVFKAALEKDIEKMESVFIHDCVDCGLCTFVCPSKIELGEHIEDGKALIAKEG